MYPNRDIRDLNKRQKQQVKYYDHTAKDLPKLKEGDQVRMRPFKLGKNKWDKAVRAKLDERSYSVETPEGTLRYRRNLCHLRKSALAEETTVKPEVIEVDDLQSYEDSQELDTQQSNDIRHHGSPVRVASPSSRPE
jgi:hypothetical protein